MTIPAIGDHAGKSPPTDQDRLLRIFTRWEWLACAAVMVGLVGLRINFALHAGGLWRDEIHSVDVARNPEFPMWQDSFPVLWIALLRTWVTLFGSSEDACVRSAGLFCSLLMLFSALWAAQGRSRAVPWTTLILFGMSPVVTTYGTEVRGYALGVAAQLWMLGSLQRCLLRPSRHAWIILVLASVVAVQAAYANSFLLLAGSVSAGIICLSQKRWWLLASLIVNGLISLVTVCPYISVLLPLAAVDWVVIVRQEFPVTWYIQQTFAAFGSGGWLPGLAWCLTCGLAGYGGFQEIVRLFRPKKLDVPNDKAPQGAFEVFVLAFGTLLVLAYLKWLKVPTQGWYYMPLLGLWAFCLDSMIATWKPQVGTCTARLVVALLLGAIQVSSAWNAANVRMTNVDVAAKSVAAEATSQDLIVLKPWFFAIPMQRYYHGDATWICLPEIKEIETSGVLVHSDGYRAVKAAMMLQDPLEKELSMVRETLRSGGRVYLVGNNIQFLRKGERLLQLPPAPNSPYGWSEGAYEADWMQQLAFVIQSNSTALRQLPLEVHQSVNPFENCQIYVATGRKDAPAEGGKQ